MESNGSAEVSVMSEVDIAEELPNGDDSAFVTEQQQEAHGEVVQTHGLLSPGQVEAIAVADQSGITTDQVFVATSQGLITADQLHQAGIKTTHIVIHDQTLNVADPGLKTPTTPLPPPTPASPSSRERGYKYQWDAKIHMDVLPVRCKNSNGELFKAKFGSGGRGKCIKMDERWFTPSEWEAECGRASSKDWKRSIRYGGRPLQCLIEDGILQPHATSCTCAACCDDESVTGPVRLFVPYKRRKRDSLGSISLSSVVAKKPRISSTSVNNNVSPSSSVSSTGQSPNKDTLVVSLTPTSQGASYQAVQMGRGDGGETFQILSTDQHGNIIAAAEPTVMVAPVPQVPPKAASPILMPVMDANEQKQWWQLEEMANNLLQQAQQLKTMIETCKQQSIASKETAFNQLKAQFEKEKTEAVNAVRIEAHMNLSRTVVEERTQKEIAVQHALAQARAEMQEKMDSVQVVAVDDPKVTYSVNWTTPGGQNQIVEAIMEGEVEELDKEIKTD